MLYLLRQSGSIVLRLLSNADSAEPIAVDALGDWNFHIPIEDTQGQTIQESGSVKFGNIEFTIPRQDVVLFTFSVPVYWAIVLATPVGRSAIRALLWGTALVFMVEVLCLLVQVEIVAYASAAQMHLEADGLGTWSREFGSRLVVSVIPFAVPVVAAVAFHRDLRSQIFPISNPRLVRQVRVRTRTVRG
ncbi:MAG: hypothetical protein M3N41_15205 [Acidobacteriota bacterium]|nr:hypothetical protein [Acidobacteriota bacterium]